MSHTLSVVNNKKRWCGRWSLALSFSGVHTHAAADVLRTVSFRVLTHSYPQHRREASNDHRPKRQLRRRVWTPEAETIHRPQGGFQVWFCWLCPAARSKLTANTHLSVFQLPHKQASGRHGFHSARLARTYGFIKSLSTHSQQVACSKIINNSKNRGTLNMLLHFSSGLLDFCHLDSRTSAWDTCADEDKKDRAARMQLSFRRVTPPTACCTVAVY
jgi:hypothetical protein